MTLEAAMNIYKAGVKTVIKTLCDQWAKILSYEKEIKMLQNKIAYLSKNPTNSSKRPSSDDITKPGQYKKKRGKRKIGGQPGHPKHQRAPFAEQDIDDFVDYKVSHCPDCAQALELTQEEPRVIQQMDLKENLIEKIEHRSYPMWCAKCDKVHYMPFPDNIIKEGLFKIRLMAIVAYMKGAGHASYSTIRKFIRDCLGEKVSRGYLRKVMEKVTASLNTPYEELLNLLPLESKVNVDETGHKENKKKLWTWVFKANLYILFRIDKCRGSKVLIDVLGEEFNGVLGCDYFSSYRKYMRIFPVILQFCIAHLIRDIKFLISLPDEQTRVYGEKLIKAFRHLFKIIHQRETMTDEEFQNALTRVKNKIMRIALEEAPSSLNEDGEEEKTEAQNMVIRFEKHGEAYFTFITTPGIDPTNNIAEQAIRFIVIDRYITQGTRSIKGRKTCERIWTVIATCTLQNRSAFDFIHHALLAYFHNKPPPSLLPQIT